MTITSTRKHWLDIYSRKESWPTLLTSHFV